jgi:hypothetical protein
MSAIEFGRTADGRASARVFSEGDRVFVRRCAEALTEDLGAEPCERFDGMDQIFWDFLISGTPVTLHWSKDAGISVLAQDSSLRSEELVRGTAQHLERRFTPTSG